MKFFISLISAIIQMNLCHSYYAINPIVMIMDAKDITLKNGSWLTTLTNKESTEQKKICESVLQARFFIFEPSDTNEYIWLLKRDKLLRRNELEMIPNLFFDHYFLEQELQLLQTCPLLLCSFGYIDFYLALYSNHEGYIIFSKSYTPVGVVTKSYRYQEYDGNLWDIYSYFSYINLLEGNKLQIRDELPLRNLNAFNRWKLCATVVDIALSFMENVSLKNKRNITITAAQFEFAELTTFDPEIEFLVCRYKIGSRPDNFTIYVTQSDAKNIIISIEDFQQVVRVYDILEFQEESSSSG